MEGPPIEVKVTVDEAELQRLGLKPGEALLVRTPDDYTPMQCQNISEALSHYLRETVGDVFVVAVPCSWDFTVISLEVAEQVARATGQTREASDG